jgi:hypothetical protein
MFARSRLSALLSGPLGGQPLPICALALRVTVGVTGGVDVIGVDVIARNGVDVIALAFTRGASANMLRRGRWSIGEGFTAWPHISAWRGLPGGLSRVYSLLGAGLISWRLAERLSCLSSCIRAIG